MAVSGLGVVCGCRVKKITWSDRVYATTDSAIYELVDGVWVRGLCAILSMTTTKTKTPIDTIPSKSIKTKYTL